MNTPIPFRQLALCSAIALSIVACSSPNTQQQAQHSANESQRLMRQEALKKKAEAKQSQRERRQLEFYSALPETIVAEEAEADMAFGRAPANKMLSASPGFIMPPPVIEPNRENYAQLDDNAIKQPVNDPVSTFSIDVDTGAYANVRRFVNQGSMPNQNAVRAEEMINYFSYDYPAPKNLDRPFNVVTEIAPSPWREGAHLLHIGIKGYEKPRDTLPPANLVFLLDVSGSMNSPDKLGLLKASLKMLVKQMRAEDSVAIAVYAGAAGVVLEPTPGNQQGKIIAALDRLSAGGSTNGGAGIHLAYNLAQQTFKDEGVNRVILATDGDFNVGTTNFDDLKKLAEQKRKTGIALTTLGFGTGNYNDHLMEQLADVGNGNYAYIDTLGEARKVLVDEMSSTLLTIAQDVKIQVEFNPATVAEYRLVGYENRLLKREDFNNDKVDAGDIGAGHTVTALYEVVLQNSEQRQLDDLRYAKSYAQSYTRNKKRLDKLSDELAFLRLRYKAPGETKSQLIEQPLKRQQIVQDLARTSDSYRFSAAVAAYAQLLKGGRYTQDFNYADIMQLARAARGQDDFGYRSEFIQLVALTDSLDQQALNQQ